ncbi:hypothetical protein JTE90_011620 [Oedothorax gibbosus]|uniref:Uncharacterized protein n=1 Tax=Oedothorax gibbosus TaxID=931172 RepID=A0AAV6U3K2_9ARAC|nr:hypothetical protein JTE90_011620 [Oedothorax gibbosus]
MCFCILNVEMFNASRKLTVLQGRNRLLCSVRYIYSGRDPQLLPKTGFESTGNGEIKKEGYGEKEICLLGPRDLRTPLPGNMGIPPISMLYTAKIRQLPQPAGDDCEVTQGSSPEQRYENLLSQAADTAAEEALFIPKKVDCQAYTCPQLLRKDFLDLFPNRDLENNNFTVLTISQKTQNDMNVWSESAEEERDSLGKYFITVANAMCDHLKLYQYWADFIHPNSGKPHLGSFTNDTMFETDERYRHFGFSIEDLGCCRIISHHQWGPQVFVGAIFTNAPLECTVVQEILNRHNGKGSIGYINVLYFVYYIIV